MIGKLLEACGASMLHELTLIVRVVIILVAV